MDIVAKADARLAVLEERESEQDLLSPEGFYVRRPYYDAVQQGEKALLRAGRDFPEAWPSYADALRSPSRVLRSVGALVLGYGLPQSRDLIWTALEEIPPDFKADFFQSVLPAAASFSFGDESLQPPERSLARALAIEATRQHPDPKARAIALSFLVVKGRAADDSDYDYDFDLLRERFEHDPDLLVQRAAVRMAGLFGDQPGNLDLKAIVLEEEDRTLLRDAIEARSYWSMLGSRPKAFELCAGVICDWLHTGYISCRDWSDEEIARLTKLLLEERSLELRDAVSMALADRYRGWGRCVSAGGRGAPQPRKIPGLKVHEWGVWQAQAGTMTPVEKLLAELPAFVHRSQVPAEELWRERSYLPGIVTKPVLFFYTPEPLSLLVRVDFFGGRPWTFFPHATDYQETTEIAGYSNWNARQQTLRIREFADRKGLTPDWIEVLRPSATPRARARSIPGFRRLPPEHLRPFYRGAPWMFPGHDRHPTLTGPGPVVFTGVGIEWCGLRVGYSSDLEAPLVPVERSHWWSALREVPSSPVAVRGESERFLFYDGAVNLRAPVTLAWEDDAHRVLLLSTTDFGAYPEVAERQRELWGEDVYSDTTRESERYPDAAPLPAVFVVSKPQGAEASGTLLEDVESRTSGIRVPLDSLPLVGQALRRRMGEVVVNEGLTVEETRALLATFEKEFFLTPGIRALTVIPRWLYDGMLPLEIDPAPGEIVRVGIIWSEGVPTSTPPPDAAPARAAAWTPRPVKVERSKVEILETPLELETGIPFSVDGDGRLSGLPFPIDVNSLARNGRAVILRELSKQPGGLYLADLEAMRAVRVATLPGYWDRNASASYRVSGYGKRVFLQRSNEKPPAFAIFDLERRRLLRAPAPAFGCTDIAASTDGSRVAWVKAGFYDAEDEVAVLDLRAGEILRVLFQFPQGSRLDGRCGGWLSVSPDGNRLACALSSPEGDAEIFVVDLVAQTAVNVSQSPAEDNYPCLAQDGRLVLFSSDRDRGQSLYLADVETRTLTRVVRQHGDGCEPWITEDGRWIFIALEGALWRKDLASGVETRLLGSETEDVFATSISADGTKALVDWTERESRRTKTRFHDLGAP
jgi:hypothetical protein